jgi:hypothetical protein
MLLSDFMFFLPSEILPHALGERGCRDPRKSFSFMATPKAGLAAIEHIESRKTFSGGE